MTISFDLVILISALGGIVAIYSSVRKILREKDEDKKKEDEKEAKVLKMLSNDKEHLEKLDDAVKDIKDHLAFQSDMTYQILDHLATNNNAGGMKRVMDEYNAHFRKDI